VIDTRSTGSTCRLTGRGWVVLQAARRSAAARRARSIVPVTPSEYDQNVEHIGCSECIADFVGDRRGEHHFGVRLGDVLLGPPLLNGEPRRDVYEVELGENGRGWVLAEPAHRCCRCGAAAACYSEVRGYWSMPVIRRAS
jgi:hypothetical protein